ncbi:glycosyltransferase involved in cell wall biosynthesis [Buttiauxella sp. BIGb0552]|uniref:glycosyltransferase family 4 protein n=1 Tax=Buttiauxella sp. BIGb0552 TaxID=2485120 RepID=UPI0010651ABD|nr:glycosyltransferase family 1 protein [Buttiauxella sp. BIGb0552]TDX16950.1 glycosyltransferase involved in cell wall biosynthesis [Buttiauxella sp. BIGb0552]
MCIKKKLLIDCRMLHNSGIGVYTEQIIQQIIKYPFLTVKLLINEDQEKNVLESYPGIELVMTKYNRYDFRNLYFNNYKLKDFDFYFVPFLSVMPLYVPRVKIISTIHDLCPIHLRKIFGWKNGCIYWILMLIQLLSSKKIIAISNFTKDQLSYYYMGLFDSKIAVIYNGVTERLCTINEDSPMKELHLESERFGIVVGNVKPHKNVIQLIEYCCQNSHLFNFKLIVIGQLDGFRTKVNNEKISSGNIIFTGKVSDEQLVNFYQNASFFVYPSLYEGFGLPLLEAMYYNLKIFASDIEIFKEIAGPKISYFNPHSFDGLIDSINYYLDSDCPKNYSYSDVLSKYTWFNTGKETVEYIVN